MNGYQKSTELGITSITPLISANGIIKLDEDRTQKRLTGAELNLMTANHFTSCKLGQRILRTETAGIAVISIFQMQWGNL